MALLAERVERLGYDSQWVEEHHADGAHWAAPLLALAAIAGATDRGTIGTDLLVLPLYDTRRLAEDVANLDQLSRGRLVLGCAIGDSARDFRLHGVDPATRGARFEEQVAVLRGLWSGSPFAFDGRFLSVPETTLNVSPARSGGPPIWIGGWGPLQVRRAATIGDAWLAGPIGTLDEVVVRLGAYDDAARRSGHDPAGRVRPVTRDVLVAATDRAAWDLAETQLASGYAADYIAPGEHPLFAGTSRTEGDLREVAERRILIGSAASVARGLQEVVRQTHTDHLILRLRLPGLADAVVDDALDRVAAEIVPLLRAWQGTDGAGSTEDADA